MKALGRGWMLWVGLGALGCAFHPSPVGPAEARQRYEACMARGTDSFHKAEYGKASREFQAAIGFVPDSVAAHNLLGVCFLRLERTEEAAAALERALALDPRNQAVLCNLGALQVIRQRFPEARSRLEQAVAVNPDFAPAHFSLAHVLLRLGDAEGAKRALQRAFALDPTLATRNFRTGATLAIDRIPSIEACLSFARTFAAAGNAEESARYLARARELGFQDWARLLAEPDFEKILESAPLKHFRPIH